MAVCVQVHLVLGHAHELVAGGAILGIVGESKAEADREGSAGAGLGQRRAQPREKRLGSRHPDLGEEHRELIVSDSADHVVGAQRAFEKLSHPAQDQIPFLIAVGVIDGREVVDIDHHDADVALRLPTGAAQLLGETLGEVAAVPQAGKLVAVGESATGLQPGELIAQIRVLAQQILRAGRCGSNRILASHIRYFSKKVAGVPTQPRIIHRRKMSFRAAILFDLDGTLVDTERDNVESVVLALRRWKVELDAGERHFVVGHSWNEIYAMLRRGHGLQAGMDEVIARAVEEKRQLLAHKGYQPLPGVRDAIKRLGRRAELAVVSGASRIEVHEAVAGLGMLSDFRVLLGAEDYSKGKPDPEPYLTAMRMLAVPPAACIVVEDAEPGILAGRAAGAHVIAVRAANYLGYDQSAADVVLDTLDGMTDDLCDRLLAQSKTIAVG